jgi:spore maturation protein CgeB
MKILFIGCKYDYGKPELGFSFEYYNLYDTLVKMNDGNHQVVLFPFDELALRYGKDQMNAQLLETVDKEKPDLCFFALFGDYLQKEIVRKITDSGTTITLNWFMDDKWRFENFSKYWAPVFNWVSTDQYSALEKYKKIGYRNVVVGGLACNHFLYKPLGLPKIYDITFIGQPHSDRQKIVAAVKSAGINIQCFGRGWPNGKVTQEEMINIFNQSKININFSACSGKEMFLQGIGRIFLGKENEKVTLKSPSTWLDNTKSFLDKQQNEIKGRNFEVPGCNAFLLTGPAQGLDQYYVPDKEVVCFYSVKDLIDKIKYYLAHEQERQAIAQAGYQRTLQDHTYEKRFNEVFKIIGL